MKKILATSWHPGGVNAIMPVIKRLRDEGAYDVVVIGHGYSESMFGAAGVEYRAIRDYGIEDAALGSMDRLLQAESPDLVLTGTSTQSNDQRHVIEQTATLAGKARGRKTLAVLDFWGNYWQRFSDAYDPDGRFKYLPDKVAIMDEIARKAMLEEGFTPEVLVVTGNPHFDDLALLAKGYDAEKRRTARQAAGASEGERVVMYATDVTSDLERLGWGFTDLDCMRMLCRGILAAESDGYCVYLAVKKHPRETEQNMSALLECAASHGVRASQTGYDTKQLALASDLVVAPASTVLVEATLMGRDALSIQPGRAGSDDFILNQLDIIPHAYDAETAAKLVSDAIAGRGQSEYYRQRRGLVSVDGHATDRIVALVHKMLE